MLKYSYLCTYLFFNLTISQRVIGAISFQNTSFELSEMLDVHVLKKILSWSGGGGGGGGWKRWEGTLSFLLENYYFTL